MKEELIDITILGSGTSTGVPMLGCGCQVCRSVDSRNRRTRCSALIRYHGFCVVIDTGTDFRQQALREHIDHVDAVLYTHAHADHVHGIDDLRAFNMTSKKVIPIYGLPPTMDSLRRTFRYIFDDSISPKFRPQLIPWPIGGDFSLFGLTVQPLPLWHGEGLSCGFRIGPLAYLADCNHIPETTMARLEGLELLVIDGLRYRSHPTHFTIEEACAVADRLGARRTLLTHLCHEVEHERDSAGLPAGVELAYDGQRVRLSLPLSAALPEPEPAAATFCVGS